MYSEIRQQTEFKSLRDGADVEFVLKRNPANGKMNAADVSAPGGEDAEESFEQQAYRAALAYKADKKIRG